MSDDNKKLKNAEQADSAWEFAGHDQLVFKKPSADAPQSWGMRAGLICSFVGLASGVLGYLIGNDILTGFDFGRIIGAWWLIFLVPLLSYSRRHSWLGVAIFAFLVAGGFGMYTVWWFWWIMALVPMFLFGAKTEKS